MLIILVRILFVIMAVLIGLTSGRYFYAQWANTVPGWFGGAMGFGIAVTLIAAEHAFRRRFTRSLVAFLVGLGAGLALAALLLVVIGLVIQDQELRRNLDIPLALVTVYLVLVTVLHNADRFRVVVPFVEFRSETHDAGSMVLDVSALTDGRLAGLLDAGMLDQRILVPRSVLVHCEGLASGSDAGDQLRAHRALETLAMLRERIGDRLTVDATEIPRAETLGDIIIELTRLEGARLLTSDSDLVERARAEGLAVLDLPMLATSLAPILRAGETISVSIEKAGEGDNQGVGYLDDGSMVVVSGAQDRVGQNVSCTVMRLHQTANGRMVFAEARGTADSERAVDAVS
ncbi:MAG: TRAM domain-containing protein [Planctomycetota bacterium]|nr:TRAM domain-containing protein [Planctomycetota bacterium]